MTVSHTPPPSTGDLPALDRLQPRGTPRRSKRGWWRAGSLIAVHLAAVAHIAHWQVTGETVSPLEPSESMWTLELGYVNAGFLVFAASILLTAIVGRWFCGWACHFIAYQDASAWLLRKLGIRPRPVRSRLLVLAPFAAAFFMFLWPTIDRWWRGGPSPAWQLELTTTRFWETFPGLVMALVTIGLGGFLIVYWLGAKGFCTYGCPYGAFYGLADRFAKGRIRVTDACGACGQCTTACTSNVRVHQEVAQYGMVVDSGCMKTMDCIATCPNDALYFGFKPQVAAKKQPARLARARFVSDFSWFEEGLMAAACIAAVLALRGAYGILPLLLVLTLGVLTAMSALLLLRLITHRSLRFQTITLKQDGRLRGAGIVAALLLLGWGGLVVHTGVVQRRFSAGQALAEQAMAPTTPTDRGKRLLEESYAQLQSAAATGLLADQRVSVALGRVAQIRGDVTAAERHLQRAIELRPDAVGARLMLSELRQQAGDAAAAAQLIERLAEDRPEHPLVRLRLAELRYRTGAQAQATQMVQALVDERPTFLDAKIRLADFKRLAGDLPEAEALLRQVLEQDPANLGARQRLGMPPPR